MNINIKYYIITISSIFIALGIGILIGFNLNNKDVFKKEQMNIISDLERKIVSLKSEKEIFESTVDKLTHDKENLNKYIESTFNKLVEEELLEKNIGILRLNEDYFYNEVEELIGSSNGNIAFDITLKEELKNIDLEALNTMFNLVDENKMQNKNDFYKFIFDNIFVTKNEEIVQKLKESNILSLNTLSEYENLDGLFVCGGSLEANKNGLEEFDKIFLDYFKDKKINIVGVQKSIVDYSYIDFFKKNKISTVDNIDEYIGKYSALKAILGNKGHYGTKKTAQSYIPEVK
ncbi:copper transporter [Peptostreptococcaceae bacterium AGR-M142]